MRRIQKLLAMLLCLVCVTGCASDRLGKVIDRPITDRAELYRLLGEPKRVRQLPGQSEWTYYSRGFDLIKLRSWRYNITYLVATNGSVTVKDLFGMSCQYHWFPPSGLPEDFEEFGKPTGR